MGRTGRPSKSWEFWRLVAVIFSVSFILQMLLLLSVAQFEQFSFCNNNLFRSPLVGIRYELEGTFEPALRSVDAVAPPPSSFQQKPPLCSKACGNGSEVIPPNTTASINSLRSWMFARNEVSREVGQLSERNESALDIKALQPLSFALFPFVKFSTYRISLRTFFVVGLSSAVARAFDTPVYNCQWQHKGSKELIKTDAEMLYIRADEGRMPYVPAIVNCTFPTPVGAEGNGGTLRLAISIKPNRLSTSGTATSNVHEEVEGEFQKFNTTLQKFERAGAAALPYKYAFCGPPMFGRIRPGWIVSWLTYHLQLYEGMEGKVRFYFYNVGGLLDEGKSVLNRFIRAGVVEIVDVLDAKNYPAHWRNQVLFINDCLHRTRYIAQWTLFHDFDEFLYIPQPNSLQSVLEENQDMAWLTFASLPASYKYCAGLSKTRERLWPVERMLWVEKQPECRYKKDIPDPWICTGPLGRRKYVVNPRKVLASGVHFVTIGTGFGGIDLNGTVARMHHYHGALATNNFLCGTDFNSSVRAYNASEFSRYKFDDSVAREISNAREVLAPLFGEV